MRFGFRGVPQEMRDTQSMGDSSREDEGDAERKGEERAAAAHDRGEHARERARVAREEAETAPSPESAEAHREEAEYHEEAARLHESAERLQRAHAAEHREEPGDGAGSSLTDASPAHDLPA